MDDARKAELEEIFKNTPYAVIGELGRGNVADVLLVRQKFLRKRFALKLIRPQLMSEQGYLERLVREAKCLGSIQSPHIVGIVDLAQAGDGTPYVVLDLMKGHTLGHELQEEGRLPVHEAIRWACQALSGLGAAHDAGLVHRDISPENLFLQERTDRPRILKVMDFGLARVLPERRGGHDSSRNFMTTNTGAIVGSPAYASPEATNGEKLDARTDIYSLGLVLFEMLTGSGPMDLSDLRVPLPSSLRPGIPLVLDEVVSRAVAGNKDERFQSAMDFHAALADIRIDRA